MSRIGACRCFGRGSRRSDGWRGGGGGRFLLWGGEWGAFDIGGFLFFPPFSLLFASLYIEIIF